MVCLIFWRLIINLAHVYCHLDYVVDCTCETVDLALGHSTRSAGSSRSSRKSYHRFVADLVHRAEVKLPVLLVALVYIDRARAHLEIAIDQYAFERVFLGGIILANKVCTFIRAHFATKADY